LNRTVEILGIDAGGTMTDTILIDTEGDMVIGKAATTPHDEAIGFVESTQDALRHWDLAIEHGIPEMKIAIYSGTAMLNTLIERKGNRVGLLVTRGMEDYLLMERGCQSYLGYHYADRLHSVTHVSNPPLVPKRWIRGIGGRIDLFGREVIPLYDHEVRQAIQELIEEGVASICICFVNSYVSPVHEKDAERIAKDVMAKNGKALPVYASSNIQPVWREASRLNCTVIEAYAADPSRKHLMAIENRLKEKGFQKQLQIMTAHGGVSNIRTAKAFRSLISGPIGGIIGSRHVGRALGLDNIICTDMGGTSFDVGLITDGTFAINPEPDLARFKLNLPMVAVDSIGAGTGTIIKVDPISKRVDLGPESVGSDPGPVCYGNQTQNPSICDCDVITGIINPDYYLGGAVRLEHKKALEVFDQKVAKPLGLDPFEAASGMIDLVESQMRNHLYAMVLGRGFETMEYYLFAYGGAGPMHVANYSRGLNFRGICIPSWAPAFSAYGCTCADYMHRYDKSLLMVIPLGADDETRKGIGTALNNILDELKARAMEELSDEAFTEDQVIFRPVFRMCYTGQLDALEVRSPHLVIQEPSHIDDIIQAFESLYEKVYARAAKFSNAGYQITEVVLLASVETTKPKLAEHPLEESTPPDAAFKGNRQVYWQDQWQNFGTWEMDHILPGNVVEGPAIVEHPATTFVVPKDYQARLDAYRIFWLGQ
jgi:acetone carboxylase, beta subunit